MVIQRATVLCGCLFMILVSGCTNFSTKTDVLSESSWPVSPEPLTQGFDGSGRLAVRDYGKGSYANFSWQNYGALQDIEVKTPLGNSVGHLCQDKQGVIAQDSRGQIVQADNIAELSQQLLGFSLPFAYLDQWVQGYRVGGEAYEILPENRLSQFGWRIQRQLKSDGQTLRMVQLTNQRFDIKLLFDEYLPASIQPNGDCQLRHQISS